MINVGVVGLGTMGQTHLDAYTRVPGARVVAISDKDGARLSGKAGAQGNIPGQSKGGYDLSEAARYSDGMDLINDPDVQMVDLCLVTPLHARFAVAALEAGKHVLIEKPLARTAQEAQQIIDAEAKSSAMAMCAQCMRFWPGWSWLKQAVESKRYGKVLSATFLRFGEAPDAPFYRDGKLSGGAALDLHIHDTDFVHHLFGMPNEVRSVGYKQMSGAVDHLTTFYQYDDVPHVVAEGGWVAHKGFGFRMRYVVVFERAVASFDIGKDKPFALAEAGKGAVAVDLEPGMGYEYQAAYFVDCIAKGEKPVRSSIQDAAGSLRILEAEVESVVSGKPVTL
jgi:predicted dehydrogenase